MAANIYIISLMSKSFVQTLAVPLNLLHKEFSHQSYTVKKKCKKLKCNRKSVVTCNR